MMNNLLIEKIIKSNNLPCPEIVYDNPLLDSNVARSLAKSFVKILKLSQQTANVSNNLRLSILENVRKMCRIEPESHIKIDENIITLLSETYIENIKETNLQGAASIEKTLDAFLQRRMKEMNLNNAFKSSINPEIAQAFINLNQNGTGIENLSQDIIHWDCSNKKERNLLKHLWTSEHIDKHMYDDISNKLKTEIEKILLEISHNILLDREKNVADILDSTTSVKNLILKSVNSAECFQICTGILNHIFVLTNFDTRILDFVQIFIRSIKDSCQHVTISVLYPTHLSHIVVLMDVDNEIFHINLKSDYVRCTLQYLSELNYENDLVMLLSHFPQWFDVYFQIKNENLSSGS